MITYRDATPEDAQALAAFARATFEATFGPLYPPHDLAAFLTAQYGPAIQAREIADPGLHTRLALETREGGPAALVGYAQFGRLKLPFDVGGRAVLELHRFYLDARAQGRGIGDALMAQTIVRARALGAQDLYLGVFSANARAQRFYARHGFDVVGGYVFPVGETRDDEHIMRLRLSP